MPEGQVRAAKSMHSDINQVHRKGVSLILACALAVATVCVSAKHAAADCVTGLHRTRAVLADIVASCATPACAAALAPKPTTACPHPDLAAIATALTNRDTAKPTIVLLGEVHDNPHHHRLRAAVIEDAANTAATPVVEHLPVTLKPTVDEFYKSRAATDRDATAFFNAVGWSKLGWPDASMFAPLYSVLLRQQSQIIAADVPKDRIRKLSRREPDALDAAERTRLRLDEPLPAPLQEDLLTELEASHCGLMPKTAFTGMAAAQNYRDAHIAAAAVDAARKTGTAIVIAGNGHIRRDRAVPYYIAKFAPDVRVVVVALLEEAASGNIPAAGQLYDWAITTPRATRPDPCEEMRRQIKPKR